MKKRMKWLPLLLMVLIFSTMGAMNVYADKTDEGTIYEGVYFNSISLAGKTEKEAEMIISDYVNELLSKPILITMGNRYLEIMPEDIGMTWMNPQIYKEAYNVGRFGNLIKRYKEQKDLETSVVELRTVFKADEELLRTLLTEKAEMLGVEPINWSMEKNGKSYEYIPGTPGTAMDIEGSFQMLVDYFANTYTLESETPELIYTVAEPLGSEEELALVKDKLGTFTTWYVGSSEGRIQNVENGTKKIDGTLLYPGEEFSVYRCVSPFTLENGYGIGYAQVNGASVESIGGGICQVSTTLYNAVLRAELEVTERFAHSMRVGYVLPAEDAAIAGDYKDLKFVNNLDHPIYIEGYASLGNLTITIYGVETRSKDREVTFESEILEEMIPSFEFKEVNQPIGYIDCVQKESFGYKACLWKIVTEKGVEVSKEKVNNSKWTPGVGKYEIGMTSSYPEAIEAVRAALEEARTTGDMTVVHEAIAYWSDEAIAARENGTATDNGGDTNPGETGTEDTEGEN